MRDLTVQDVIDIRRLDEELQEPAAVAKAKGLELEDVLRMPAREYMTCRDQVLDANGLR
jgi:hypothetical protein